MKTARIMTTLLATTLAAFAQVGLAENFREGPRGPSGGSRDVRHDRRSDRYNDEIKLIRDSMESARRNIGIRTFERANVNMLELSRRVQAIRSDRERTQLLGLIADTQNAISNHRASYEFKIARLNMNGNSMIRVFENLDDDRNDERHDAQSQRAASEAYQFLGDAQSAASRGDFNRTLNAATSAQQRLVSIRVRAPAIDSAKSRVAQAIQRLNTLAMMPGRGGPAEMIRRVALRQISPSLVQAQQDLANSGLLERGRDNGHRDDHGRGPRPR